MFFCFSGELNDVWRWVVVNLAPIITQTTDIFKHFWDRNLGIYTYKQNVFKRSFFFFLDKDDAALRVDEEGVHWGGVSAGRAGGSGESSTGGDKCGFLHYLSEFFIFPPPDFLWGPKGDIMCRIHFFS